MEATTRYTVNVLCRNGTWAQVWSDFDGAMAEKVAAWHRAGAPAAEDVVVTAEVCS